ncbi:MAG: DNA polymerase III subunit delta, partial [Bacteroidota bacterium]
PESYFIDQITEYIEENVLAESEKAFNFTVLYGKEADHLAVMDIARRFPMMAERQVVILKEAQQMRDLTKLEKYIVQPMPSTLLVICHKHKKLDMRSAFAKAVKKNAVVFEAKPLYDNQVPDFIRSVLKSSGFDIQPEAAQLVAEYLGTNLSKINNELDKLMLNVPAKSLINLEHIQENIGISKDYNVFELQNALGDRNALKANRIIQYFAANPKAGPLPMVMGTLYNFFSKLYMVYFAKGASDKELATMLGFRSDWFLKDYKRARMRYSRAETERNIALLREYDLKSKGLDRESASDHDLMKELIFRILH